MNGLTRLSRLSFTLAALLVLVACSDSPTAPGSDAIIGEYTLESVNGQQVPGQTAGLGGGHESTEWVRGHLTLSDDGTFRTEVTVNNKWDGEWEGEGTLRGDGDYRVDANVITYYSSRGRMLARGTIGGGSVTLQYEQDAGYLHTFTR